MRRKQKNVRRPRQLREKICVNLCGAEYRRWLTGERMILLPCVWIVLYVMVTKQLQERAESIGEPYNILEVMIGLCNSRVFLCFLPILFLVLLSDFPRVDENIYFLFPRAGWKPWVLGQMIFLGLADATFLLAIFAGATLPCCVSGFWYNGWSEVVTRADQLFPELSGTLVSRMIPADLYAQMLPYPALAVSMGLVFLYLYLLGMILMIGRLTGNGWMGFLVGLFVVLAGAATAELQWGIQWIFPAAHSILAAHFQGFFREMRCPVETSVLYLGGASAVLAGSIFVTWKGKDGV